MHTIKVIGLQPYDLKEGPKHWDAIKEEVAEANLKYLRRFAPNLTDDKILAKFVVSPLDIERRNPHMWHGSVHSGSSEPSQSGNMRPMPGWAQYRMPIPGLYQTGACTYPGGSVTGAPGTKRSHGDAQGFWYEHRRSGEEDLVGQASACRVLFDLTKYQNQTG